MNHSADLCWCCKGQLTHKHVTTGLKWVPQRTTAELSSWVQKMSEVTVSVDHIGVRSALNFVRSLVSRHLSAPTMRMCAAACLRRMG